MTAPAVTVQDTVLVAGKNKAVPLKAIDNADRTFTLVVDIGGAASVTLTASELEIGHVAIKNDLSEDHQTVAPDGQVVNATYPLEGALVAGTDGTNLFAIRTDASGNLRTKGAPGTAITAGANVSVAGLATALTAPPAGTRRMTVQNVGPAGSEMRVREVGGLAGTGVLLARLQSATFGSGEGAIEALEADNATGTPIAAIVFEN